MIEGERRGRGGKKEEKERMTDRQIEFSQHYTHSTCTCTCIGNINNNKPQIIK